MATILITGANRGIGLGLLKHYLEQGEQVLIGVRNIASESLQKLAKVYPDQLAMYPLDIGNESSIQSFASTVCASVNKLDLVINNAGVCDEIEPASWTFAYFETHFRINTIGPILLGQSLVPKMQAGAKLINTTSGMGSAECHINPTAGLDAYAASKCALNILTRRFSEKVREQGMIAVAMSPGWVQTEMGGAGATTSVKDAVASISSTIAGLTMEQSGTFISEQGSVIPW